jgi:imidazolonepropionase-like amidohydrolase
MQVIFAGRLIDGTGAAAQRDRAVYVEDGRILGIDRIGDVPSDAQVIDHSSHSVLPGLIDCHVHLVFSHSANPLHEVLAEDDFQLLLRGVANAHQALGAGVTTVRDLGGRGGVTFRLRDAIQSGLIVGPRILAAGSPITITGGHCNFLGLEADDEVSVRKAARKQLKSGANCLKIMATGGRMTPRTNVGMAQYTVAQIQAAVGEARRANVTLAAHAIGTDGIRNAAFAGVDTIEHCSWLGHTPLVDFDESVAAHMARVGAATVPTLATLAQAMAATPGALSEGVKEHLALRPELLRCLRRMVELGVPILAGTDAGVAWTPFDSLPLELESLVSEVGLAPMQAIESATGEAARVLGIDDYVGTLVPGRLADLIAVEGDPSVRISDLRAVRMVMKEGKTMAAGRLAESTQNSTRMR